MLAANNKQRGLSCRLRWRQKAGLSYAVYSMQTTHRQTRIQFIGDRSMRRQWPAKLNVTELQAELAESGRAVNRLGTTARLWFSAQGVRHILLSLNALRTTGRDGICRRIRRRRRDGRTWCWRQPFRERRTVRTKPRRQYPSFSDAEGCSGCGAAISGVIHVSWRRRCYITDRGDDRLSRLDIGDESHQRYGD